MTYKQFSELKNGAKITLAQFHAIYDGCPCATIMDNSVRGAKTVDCRKVTVGDWVNNGTMFIEIVSD